MQKKIIITISIVMCALYTIGNAAIILNFPNINIQSLQDNFSLVHFVAPGNNFGGSILRLPTKSVTGTVVSLNGAHKTCTKLLRGLYYNSQRGKRLRPLDSDTLQLLQQQDASYNNLQIEGGLYTTCDTTYSIFGHLQYTRGGVVSRIVAGTKINYANNKIIRGFANGLQYFDNKIPIGYLYDSNGGVGYVGGSLTGHENLIAFLNAGGSINSGFIYSGNDIISHNPGRETIIENGNKAIETMRNIIVQGSVGLSKSINQIDRISLLGSLQNKTVIYNGSDINSSTLINVAKQKAQELCQGRQINLPLTNSEKIACYDSDLTINLDDGWYANKTIIVKNANVILEGGMNNNSEAINLFIDKGFMYIPNEITSQNFNTEGFPTDINPTNSGLYLKGNIIINGLIIGGLPGAETGFNHKLHVQGKITTLNTPLEPNEGRVSQIENIFGVNYDNFINLQKVFVRECGLNGKGSDASGCNTGNVISTTPLVILNGNYPSDIVQ
ncbi:MAG: hypothetical protein NTY80_00065 [candidate division SR1 bacterium]|nr:hypothetical protein [candidate division SR1 bacterium]